jgi:hypothetical protein
VSDGV